jgi:hypothetical protein
MQEIIKKIYERMEFCANAHTNCQATEKQYILEISLLNEVLDQIETFPWENYQQELN